MMHATRCNEQMSSADMHDAQREAHCIFPAVFCNMLLLLWWPLSPISIVFQLLWAFMSFYELLWAQFGSVH